MDHNFSFYDFISGVLQTHDLPLTYDFHNYMLRSMDEEFRDIVGVRYIFFLQMNLVTFLIIY